MTPEQQTIEALRLVRAKAAPVLAHMIAQNWCRGTWQRHITEALEAAIEASYRKPENE